MFLFCFFLNLKGLCLKSFFFGFRTMGWSTADLKSRQEVRNEVVLMVII